MLGKSNFCVRLKTNWGIAVQTEMAIVFCENMRSWLDSTHCSCHNKEEEI